MKVTPGDKVRWKYDPTCTVWTVWDIDPDIDQTQAVLIASEQGQHFVRIKDLKPACEDLPPTKKVRITIQVIDETTEELINRETVISEDALDSLVRQIEDL